MNHENAKALLASHFPHAKHIDAVNQGNKFEVLIVDDGFVGKRLVQRQQAIYAIFNEHIKNGTIHALTIHALTPDEYSTNH